MLVLKNILIEVLKRLLYGVLNVFRVCLAYACELCEVRLRWLMVEIVVPFLFFCNLSLRRFELKQLRFCFGNFIQWTGFHFSIVRLHFSNR